MEINKIIRGNLTTLILQLLSNNGRMYGYEMVKAVWEGSRERMKITEAALYPALHKLEAAGLIVVAPEWVNGRMRKYYWLSRKGKKEAALQREGVKESIVILQKLFKYQIKKND